ncbi:MXAN_6640 family putative metalloprotease [Nocardioides currus]|uniref:MXAN_6640 family putative metalloprotease n=1 Tax=Nocardioides currus TaxID=2133958 RepID=UPI0014041372|nr:MXAN_6640 family putative metalloprotease [Nocardioides currus]
MRRSMMLAVVVGLVLSPLSMVSPATADPTPLPADPNERVALTALDTAGRVLAGDARPTDPSATVALRDLWLARPDLTGTEAAEATALLARPTDGPADPFGNGYTVPSTSQCGAHVCVHYVPTTADAPPSVDWVALNLATMEAVYEREVNQLGFRAPRPDGTNGGNGLLDVYLKDLGTGLYGYCAAEFRKKGRTASGFCVLDNDYSAAQFPAQTPEANLTVTAAHEFFHAVQYSYDYDEDPWMLESTATWMEEQVADDINDNRQYLRYSQLQAPFVPLDAFSSTYGFQYGNWIFWQYLTDRFGTKFTKLAWESAGSLKGDGGKYSTEAIASVLRKKKQSLTNVYADFAAANIVPSSTYPEAPGVAEYANPPVLADVTLTKGQKKFRQRAKVDHLAADAMHVRPGADLAGKKWRLRVSVKAPRRLQGAAARLVIHKTNGKVAFRTVKFNRRNNAVRTVPFSAAKVSAVSVSFANVSTRFKCKAGTTFACGGRALQDNAKFTITSKVVKKAKRKHKHKH